VYRPLAIIAVAAAGSVAAAGVTSAASSVSVTAGKPTEFHFKLSGRATHGKVTFHISNRGTVSHDFKIAGKKSKVLRPGKSTTLSVTLKRGTYSYRCTLPGHAAAGMKGRLTVR
jgi:uncharacterized cupredoxin-like copper-binding protein